MLTITFHSFLLYSLLLYLGHACIYLNYIDLRSSHSKAFYNTSLICNISRDLLVAMLNNSYDLRIIQSTTTEIRYFHFKSRQTYHGRGMYMPCTSWHVQKVLSRRREKISTKTFPRETQINDENQR